MAGERVGIAGLRGMDRINERVPHLYHPMHPAILRLLDETVRAAHDHGRWAGVCGEMAGDARAIPILVGLAFDELSMASGRILEAKDVVRHLDYGSCRRLADRPLTCETAEEVERLVKEVGGLPEWTRNGCLMTNDQASPNWLRYTPALTPCSRLLG